MFADTFTIRQKETPTTVLNPEQLSRISPKTGYARSAE